MSQYKQMAENATMQSFLNCFYVKQELIDLQKETKADGSLVFVAALAKQDLELVIPIRYFSPVGRHLFDFPFAFARKAVNNRERSSITPHLLLYVQRNFSLNMAAQMQRMSSCFASF